MAAEHQKRFEFEKNFEPQKYFDSDKTMMSKVKLVIMIRKKSNKIFCDLDGIGINFCV